LKMMIGAIVGSVAAILHLSTYFMPTDIFQDFPVIFAFTYFFTLIGAIMIIIGIADYLGRGQYRRRIHELEQRRSQLRARMYEAFVTQLYLQGRLTSNSVCVAPTVPLPHDPQSRSHSGGARDFHALFRRAGCGLWSPREVVRE